MPLDEQLRKHLDWEVESGRIGVPHLLALGVLASGPSELQFVYRNVVAALKENAQNTQLEDVRKIATLDVRRFARMLDEAEPGHETAWKHRTVLRQQEIAAKFLSPFAHPQQGIERNEASVFSEAHCRKFFHGNHRRFEPEPDAEEHETALVNFHPNDTCSVHPEWAKRIQHYVQEKLGAYIDHDGQVEWLHDPG